MPSLLASNQQQAATNAEEVLTGLQGHLMTAQFRYKPMTEDVQTG